MKRTLYLSSLLLFLSCTAPTSQPILVKSCQLAIRLSAQMPLVNPALVTIGERNKVARRMPLSLQGRYYEAIISVPAESTYYWIEDGDERYLDPHNALQTMHNGELVSLKKLHDCATPDIRFVERHGGPTEMAFTLVLARAQADAALDGASPQAWVNEEPVTIHTQGDHLYVEAKGLDLGKYTLRITASDIHGRVAEFSGPFWIEPKQFRWQGASAYHLIVDRFAGDLDLGPRARTRPPGLRVGGNLRGVIRKIRSGYFDRLGINVLWLSPLYRNADGRWIGVEGGPPRYESYHGYWPIAAREIDQRLGTAEELKSLVLEAHARGIRVIADVVPNHVHQDHEYHTLYPSWFSDPACICGHAQCPWWRDIESCWFTPYLPDINWRADGALEHVVDDMLWWLSNFDLDGLRVDAVPMMPRRVTRHLVASVKKKFETLDTPYYLLGETFTGPNGYDAIRYPLGANGLDGQFDFPLMWAIRQALAWETTAVSTLFDQWTTSQAQWAGAGALMATIIGNHDVSRFATEASGEWFGDDPFATPAKPSIDPDGHGRMRRALGFMLTMPGLPVLYYGDEFGQTGGRDPDNRRPMRFTSELTALEQETLKFTQRIGRLRHCHEAFHDGVLDIISIGEDIAVYRRVSETGSAVVIRLWRPTSAENETQPRWQSTEPMVDVVSGRISGTTGLNEPSFVASMHGFEVWVPITHQCAFEDEYESN